MNTARLTRYDVSASLSARGGSPMSAAIAGSEVAITVESMFSMNSAQATMSGIRSARRMRLGGNVAAAAAEGNVAAAAAEGNVVAAAAEGNVVAAAAEGN